MSDLRRWSEDGATASELSLLESSRREHAPARARERAAKALGLAALASSVTGAATATAMTTRGSAFLLKLLSIPVVGAGLVVGGVAVLRSPRAAAPPVVSSAVSAPAATAAIPNAPPLESPPAAPEVAASSSVRAAVPRAPRAEASSGRLSREVQALGKAQEALAAHDPGAALRLLDRYGAEFPGGALGSEATVLRVRALLASGNRPAAQRLADTYSVAHPDTPYARRIQDTVRSGH